MSTPGPPALDVVGLGSMVVDRVHRVSRMLGVDEKGVLAGVDGASPVRAYVGGVVLNHLGWAAPITGPEGQSERLSLAAPSTIV